MHANERLLGKLLWSCVMLAAAASMTTMPVRAVFAIPGFVPVDRLIRNVTAYTKEHPEEAQGYYVLARVQSLAYTRKSRQLRAYGDPDNTKELPKVDHQLHDLGPRKEEKAGAAPSGDELRTHMLGSLTNFHKALKLAPETALYHLGLAYTLEAGSADARDTPLGVEVPKKLSRKDASELEALVAKLGHHSFRTREDAQRKLRELGPRAVPVLRKHVRDKNPEIRSRIPRLFQHLWKGEALRAYRRAYQLSIQKDLKMEHRPLSGLRSLVGYEAGHGCLRLLLEAGAAGAELKEIAQIQKNLKELNTKPRGPITPIIFSLDSACPLEDLLAREKSVRFDLDGDGKVEKWPWVKPETALLVWDPNQSGRITSGRQLFGTVTWWMFWRDGYQALDALDDNRNGMLSGTELRGLAAWRDTNSNGVSEPGEVVPLGKLDIESVAVHATKHVGDGPANPAGLRLRDGRQLPTYDWMVKGIESD